MTKSNSIQIIVIALLLVFITSCKITTKARVDKFSTDTKINTEKIGKIEKVFISGMFVYDNKEMSFTKNDTTYIVRPKTNTEIKSKLLFTPTVNDGKLNIIIDDIEIALSNKIPLQLYLKSKRKSLYAKVDKKVDNSNFKNTQTLKLAISPQYFKSSIGKMFKKEYKIAASTDYFPNAIAIDSLDIKLKVNAGDNTYANFTLLDGKIKIKNNELIIEEVTFFINIEDFVSTFDRKLNDYDFINGEWDAIFRANTTINAVTATSIGLGSMFNVGRHGNYYTAHTDKRVDYWLHFVPIEDNTGIKIVPEITNVHGFPGEAEQLLKNETFIPYVNVAKKYFTFGYIGMILKDKKRQENGTILSLKQISNNLSFKDFSFVRTNNQKGIAVKGKLQGTIKLK